jgi:cell division septum initiation protein DivIVA
MKTFITLMLVTVLFMGLTFLGMPFIIEKETAKLKSEIGQLKVRMEELEKFKAGQETAWKTSGLRPDANIRNVVKAITGLSSRIADLEDYSAQRATQTEGMLEKQAKVNADLLAKQSEMADRYTRDTVIASRKNYLNTIITSITAHILEAKIELASRNIGNVKAALQVVSGELQKVKEAVEDRNKKAFDDLNVIVGNIKSELDVSLMGANNMINLLWYEFEKTASAL